jgi:hypothetical protein
VPGEGRIQLRDQKRILNQLGPRYDRSHHPEVNDSSREDFGDTWQPLA